MKNPPSSDRAELCRRFATRLAEARQTLWMTCPQIARRLRVSVASYRYWESGQGLPIGNGVTEIEEKLDALLLTAKTPWAHTDPASGQ